MAAILIHIVNWMSLPVLVVLLVVLLRRGAHSEFPYFFCYVLVGVLVDLIRLFVHQFFLRAYFYTFETTDALIVLFTFLVTYELFVGRLFPRFYAVRFYRYLFPAAAFVITLIAVPAALANRKISVLLAIIHGVQILRVVALLFFVGLMVIMGRRWKRYEFGIALGVALQSSAMLIASANWARSLFVHHISDWFPSISYDVACLVWLVTFSKSEKPTSFYGKATSQEVVQQAKEWEAALKESISAKKRKL